MGKIITLILILVVYGILWAFPLWAVVNFVCWAFHLSFHLSIGKYVENTVEDSEEVVKEFKALYEDKAIIKRQIYYKPFGIADIGVFYLP